MTPQLDTTEIDKEIDRDSEKNADKENADDQWIKQLHRDEEAAFHWVKMGCIYLVPILAASVIIVYVLNLLLPLEWRWLTPEDLSGIQNLAISIFSGVATSLSVNYFYKTNKQK